MGQANATALCERLARLPTAAVSDVLTAMGCDDQVISWTLRSLGPFTPFAGPAVCFAGSDGKARDDAEASLIYETDRRMSPGCVAVIATGGHRIGAVIGGNSIAGWRKRGCAALLTDGLVRDVPDFEGLPTFAAGITPMSNRGLWAYRSLDRPVRLPGQRGEVVIAPGDIVHADGDGVLVVPATHLAALVRDVEITCEIERRMREQIDAGVDRQRVYESHDRFGHVRRAGNR